jgi:glycosyltransferase involved in cell wall biosynthesis
MSQDGVTIAIPNWNHEVFLPRSILSALKAVALLRSRGVPSEVLVIDDSSRDGSPTLLRQMEALYQADGLRLASFGANGGLAANRNYALSAAKYRYLTFLDADNELIPENLPTLIDTLKQTGAASAYGNLLVRSIWADKAHDMVSNESIQPKLHQINYIDAFAAFDRFQLLDVGGYETWFQTYEDYELWLHLSAAGRRIVFVPVVLGYYYVVPGSMAQHPERNRVALERITRVFNQVGIRAHLPAKTRLLRYHPALGYM